MQEPKFTEININSKATRKFVCYKEVLRGNIVIFLRVSIAPTRDIESHDSDDVEVLVDFKNGANCDLCSCNLRSTD